MSDDPLTGKKVVILGLARQGTALAKWLCSIEAEVIVSDLRHPDQLADEFKALDGLDITYVLGEHPSRMLDGAELLCLSGGVPVDAPIVQEAVARGITLSNDAQIFLDRCPCDVIGITGSAGKTTTTALTGAMFEETDRLPWIGGNIGNPLITDLPYIRPNDVAVMELSSFQLEIMTTSPHIAAVLNVTPNHLDRHKTMEAYIEAKAHILDHQVVSDFAVLGIDDPAAAALEGRTQQKVAHFSAQMPVDVGAWLEGETLVIRRAFEQAREEVCRTSDLALRGRHNVLNALATCAIAAVASVPVEAMRAAIKKFRPVAHRLEVVGQINGATYVNDSIATAPERVLAAVRSFTEPLILLLGGRDKNLPWQELLQEAVPRCRAIVVFGEAAQMIAQETNTACLARGVKLPLAQVNGLEDAIQRAYQVAQEGDVVLLSPGCTSYDAYKDFEERGEHFRRLVNSLEITGGQF
jgi:UDP-N-acetylmuramoylalanine--D-glutamate ligase